MFFNKPSKREDNTAQQVDDNTSMMQLAVPKPEEQPSTLQLNVPKVEEKISSMMNTQPIMKPPRLPVAPATMNVNLSK